MYLPVLQDPRRVDAGNLIVRHAGLLDARSGLESVVKGTGRHSTLYVRTAEAQTSLVLGRERLLAQVSSYFAALGVLVVLVGLYGVVAYAVAHRRRELAIRAAIGAQRRRLLTTLVGETAWMTIAGIAIGLPTALWARSAIQGLLFDGAQERGPALVTATAIMLVASIIAAILPSRQVLKGTLLEALRLE